MYFIFQVVSDHGSWDLFVWEGGRGASATFLESTDCPFDIPDVLVGCSDLREDGADMLANHFKFVVAVKCGNSEATTFEQLNVLVDGSTGLLFSTTSACSERLKLGGSSFQD